MKILEVADITALVRRLGFDAFIGLLIDRLERDFRRWPEFDLSPRHATEAPGGVLELMPCSDGRRYSVKYVNGHPGNTARGKLSVVAVGMLASVDDGYPLLISEMTLLTALRTAATAALAARYLARPGSRTLGIIGTGAQSEFVLRALQTGFPIERVRYFDRDARAMAKFRANLAGRALEKWAAPSAAEVVPGCDMLVTATALRRAQQLVPVEALHSGLHIHAMGGDCAGKTELPPALLERSTVVVEYLPQSMTEGEVQQCGAGAVHAELWEVVSGRRAGRESADEITLFDCVGFALEDFSALSLVCDLASEYELGRSVELLPSLADPKDLYGLLR